MALLKTNTGIGTTNPTSALHVIGDVLVTGVVTATTFSGNINAGVATITTLNSTNATITNINSSGITTVGIVTANQLFVTGVSTFTGIVTNRSTIFGTQLSVSGVSTFRDNVRLIDNKTLSLGDSDDLQLIHDGSNSFIKDTGTGSLILNTNKLEVKNAANNETGLIFNQDGAVELFFDNSKRFETTGIGVSLTEVSNGAATLTGPSTIIIDPAAVGDNTGAVRIKGDLYVDGTQFIVNSSTIELADLRVGIATTVGTNLLLDGGGIGIGSDSILKTFTYNFTSDALKSSEHLDLATGKVYKINGTEVLSATQLTVPNIFATGVTTIGVASLSQLLVTGISTFTGLVDANGGATIDNIQIGISGDNEIDTSTGDLILDSAAGTVNVTDQLVVSGISTFNSDVDIDQSLNVDANLIVTGLSTFVGVVTTQNNVFVGNNLGVANDVSISNNLNVTGLSTFTGLLDANGGATIDNVRIGVAGDNEIDTSTGNLTIDSAGGTVTVDDQLTVTGSATFNVDVDIDRDLNVDRNVTVTGLSTFTGLLDANGGATIDNVRIGVADNNTIDTSIGNLTLDSFAGTITINDQLNVSGVTTLASLGGITTTGGDLFVGGDLYVADDLVFDEATLRNINVTGIGTIANLNGNVLNYTIGNIVTGLVTSISGTNLNYTGVGTIATLNSTTGTITNLSGTNVTYTTGSFTNGNIVTGIVTTISGSNLTYTTGNLTTGNIVTGLVTSISGTNLNYTGVGTIATLNSTTGTITNLSGSNATYNTGSFTNANVVTGIITSLSGTNATYNTGSFTNANVVTGIITSLSGTNATYNTGSFTNANVVTGIITSLSGTNATYTTVNATTGNIVTGIVTSISGTNLNYTGVGTITRLNSTNATLTNINSTGITTLGIVTAGQIFVSGVTTSTGGFVGNLTGIAASATQLVTPRTFEITGDIVASPISFDGTANVSLAATIQPNSVGLGTDTFGDYVQSISGTANQITVTNGSGEGSTPVISIPTNPVLPGNVTIANDLQVNNNLNVTGNITIGGTSAYIIADDFRVKDADIVLGFTTNTFGQDVSNDDTANHGGVAVASTVGTPLVELFIAGIETNPATYKKIMWFKAGAFAGLGTDAWLSNYAVGIGSTQFPTGTRLAAGSVQFTERDLAVVRDINASGIITASVGNITTLNSTNANVVTGIITNLSGTNATYTNGSFTNANVVTGVVTSISGTNLNYVGVGTITTLNSTTGTITNLSGTNATYNTGSFTNANVVTGVVTSISGTNLNYENGNFIALNSTLGNIVTGVVTTISGSNLTYTTGNLTNANIVTGVVTSISGTNLNYTGVGTITTLNSTTGTITNLSGTNATYNTGSFTNANVVTGVVTSISGTNATYNTGSFTNANVVTGIITSLSGTNATYTTGSFTNANVVTGVVTSISGTNLNYTGVGTVTTLNSTDATLSNINSSGISTLGIVTANQLFISGVSTFVGVITNRSTIFGTQLSVSGLSTLASLHAPRLTYNGVDFGNFSGFVPVANGAGGWSWQSVTSTFSVNNILNGFNVFEEGAVVGTAGSITTLDFRGNNILAFADPQPNGIATIRLSDTPTFDSLGVTGITTLGVTTSTSLSANQLSVSGVSTFVGIATFIGDLFVGGDLYVADDLVFDSFTAREITVTEKSSLGFASATTLNVTGISTFTNVNASNINVTGIVTASAFNGNVNAGVGTITTLNSTTGNITTLNSTIGNIVTGVVTSISGTNLNYTGVGTIATLNSTNASITTLSNTNINSSGVITATQFSTGVTGSAINITSNLITGPALITIDPAAVGDDTGAVRIKGDFYVDGTQTIINSQTIDLADFRIGIGTTATSDVVLDGAGIGIGSASNQKTFTWNNSSSSLKSSENLDLASGKTYKINGVDVLSSTTLGSSVVNSSLTSVGTLGQLQVTGISTFTNGPVLVGSATSSGTLDQKLQITGGTYISGSTGIGTTNPGYKLHVIGDVNFTGSLYQNGSQFAAGVGIGSTSVNPQSGVINQRIGVGFTDLNIVGTGISVTGYGSTVVIDFGNIAAASGGALSISTVFAPRIQDVTFVGGASTTRIGISTQTDRFVYDTQTGSVGIGTSGSSIPSYKLDVIGDINSSTSVKIKGVDVLEEAVRLAIALG